MVGNNIAKINILYSFYVFLKEIFESADQLSINSCFSIEASGCVPII